MTSEPQRPALECKGCGGSGDCRRCGGSGYLWNFRGERKKKGEQATPAPGWIYENQEDLSTACNRCEGTGACPGCGGSGWIVPALLGSPSFPSS